MRFFSRFIQKNKLQKEYQIGIVLSGGGVRGITHLGVLKALEENNIYPDIISGVSAGAIIGAFYADGYKPEEIFDILDNNSLFDFAKITIPKDGLLSINNLSKVLHEYLYARKFDDLKIPLIIAASNLNDGEIVYFKDGDLIDKIVASASIPVLFKPSIIHNKTFVDGGLFDNLPIDPIRKKCKKIIASHVNPTTQENNLDSILNIAQRTFHLAIRSKVVENSKHCDLFIEPQGLRNYSLFNASKNREMFNIGYETTIEMLTRINWKFHN